MDEISETAEAATACETDPLEMLDTLGVRLTTARAHAHGGGTDACLHDLIACVAMLAANQRLLVRAAQGDEHAARLLTGA